MEEYAPKPRKSFLRPGGTGRHIVGLLGDSLMQMGGLQPHYMPMMERRALWERADRPRSWPETYANESFAQTGRSKQPALNYEALGYTYVGGTDGDRSDPRFWVKIA